jgi:DNA end-binding protein Ku
VSIPVDLVPGLASSDVRMRMLGRRGQPLERRYRCPAHDELVDDTEVVRGAPVDDDEFVVVTDEELERLSPDRSRDIDLDQVVGRDDIDPMRLARTYLLLPSGGSTKPYRLLVDTMDALGRAGIARFVMRGKEYLAAIVAEDGWLRAHTLRHDAELRDVDDVGLVALPEPDADRVDALVATIESMRCDELDAEILVDARAQRLRELAEAKYERGEDTIEAPDAKDRAPLHATVVDLMQSLKARLAKAQ